MSHETIYQALYVQGHGSLRLEVATALRSGRVTRRRQRPEGPRPQRFRDMVMISDRPAEIEDRAVPGHWEGDLIIGSTASRSAIGTLVERTSGYVMLLHLPGDHTARTVADAMITAMNTLPEELRRSTTWDQGAEMSRHQEITVATGMPIYFCAPHSPWQRGSNENTNGLLREYLPKSTDLSFHGPGILENVAAELNRRPRKRHCYRTPGRSPSHAILTPNKSNRCCRHHLNPPVLCLGISPADVHVWLIPKEALDMHVIGQLGQHTGSDSLETYWFDAGPGAVQPWLEPYGNQLADAREHLAAVI